MDIDADGAGAADSTALVVPAGMALCAHAPPCVRWRYGIPRRRRKTAFVIVSSFIEEAL
jgi:hypothetical protein